MPAGPGSHQPVASLEGRREEGPGDRRWVGSSFVQNRFSVTSQHPSKPVSCRPEVRTVLANSGSAPSRCRRPLSPSRTQPSPRRASGHVTPLESSGRFPHQRSRDRKAGGFLRGVPEACERAGTSRPTSHGTLPRPGSRRLAGSRPVVAVASASAWAAEWLAGSCCPHCHRHVVPKAGPWAPRRTPPPRQTALRERVASSAARRPRRGQSSRCGHAGPAGRPEWGDDAVRPDKWVDAAGAADDARTRVWDVYAHL